jgi:hypothetical protein
VAPFRPHIPQRAYRRRISLDVPAWHQRHWRAVVAVLADDPPPRGLALQLIERWRQWMVSHARTID